jgi:hypothetical protein
LINSPGYGFAEPYAAASNTELAADENVTVDVND